MLSSASSARGGMKYSIAARSLPSGLRIGVTASGQSRVGAIIKKPSGSRCSRPRRTTNVRRYAGLVCTSWSPSPSRLQRFDAPGDGGDEVVGALLDLKAVFVDGREHAAEPRPGLEQRQLAARIEFHQPMRRRQSGNAAADDRDASGSGGSSELMATDCSAARNCSECRKRPNP